jgi:hypothetical protein
LHAVIYPHVACRKCTYAGTGVAEPCSRADGLTDRRQSAAPGAGHHRSAPRHVPATAYLARRCRPVRHPDSCWVDIGRTADDQVEHPTVRQPTIIDRRSIVAKCCRPFHSSSPALPSKEGVSSFRTVRLQEQFRMLSVDVGGLANSDHTVGNSRCRYRRRDPPRRTQSAGDDKFSQLARDER